MIVWTGSKKWLIKSLNPMEECYEPFAGAGHISLTCAKVSHLNDLSDDLISCYSQMINDKKFVIDEAREIFIDMMNNKDPSAKYYDIRAKYNSGKARDASHFLVLLCGGFNGLWRKSNSGCNVPFGGTKRKFPYESLMSTPVDKIGRLTNLSWVDASIPNETCVVYADPPYAGLFVGYTSREWTQHDNDELFTSLSLLPNPVLISCSETSENLALFKKLNFDYIVVKKSYSNAGHTVRKDEILAFNAKGMQYIKFSTLPRTR